MERLSRQSRKRGSLASAKPSQRQIKGIIDQASGTVAPVNPPCTGDLNCSGLVDGPDLALLLGAWRSANPTLDLNHDGVVNAADLAVALGAWGACG